MNYSFIINHSKVVEIYDDANELIGYHWAFQDAFANVINLYGTLTIDDWDYGTITDEDFFGCISEEDFDHIVFASISLLTYEK